MSESDTARNASNASRRLTAAIRRREPTEVIDLRRRELARAQNAHALAQAIASAPPLTDEQAERVGAILRSA